MQLTRKNVILGKVETTSGVDASPAPANALAVRSLNVTPVEVELIENNIQRPTMGSSKKLQAGKHAVLDFEIALAPSGAAGVVPQYDDILCTCGREKTIVADTSAAYSPIDANFKTMTFYWYMDGSLHKILGAMGSSDLTFDRNNLPILKASYVGLYQPVTQEDLPTADFSSVIDPIPVGAITTPEFKLYGINTRLEKLEIKDGSDIKYRNVVGGEYVIQTDRQMSGSIVFEAPAITETNWWDKIVENNETGSLLLKHGTTAGNIIEISQPCIQLSNLKYGDSDGVVTLEADISIIPVTGNDESIITYK